MTETLAPGALAPETARPTTSGGGELGWAVRDAVAMTRRNVLRLARSPELLVFLLIQPVMFTLLFRYVFGGAIGLPGGINYPNYLIPGIAAQTAIFGATTTAVGLAEDLATGFVDRLRSLPMARSAVLVGRIAADAFRNVLVIVILMGVGIAVGFRPHAFLPTILGLLLILGFSISISCAMALIGLKVKGTEAAQAASFPIVFPFTFASSAFVPVATMPGWLQAFAKHQPFTVVVDAFRSLAIGPISTPTRQLLFHGDSSSTLVLEALAWIVGMTLVFGLLAVRSYRRIS